MAVLPYSNVVPRLKACRNDFTTDFASSFDSDRREIFGIGRMKSRRWPPFIFDFRTSQVDIRSKQCFGSSDFLSSVPCQKLRQQLYKLRAQHPFSDGQQVASDETQNRLLFSFFFLVCLLTRSSASLFFSAWGTNRPVYGCCDRGGRGGSEPRTRGGGSECRRPNCECK